MSNHNNLQNFFMGHAEIRFPHGQITANSNKFLYGSCGNLISAWPMWKSDFFSVVRWRFHEMYGNLSMTGAYTNSYRNIIFKTYTVDRQWCHSAVKAPFERLDVSLQLQRGLFIYKIPLGIFSRVFSLWHHWRSTLYLFKNSKTRKHHE